MNPAVSVHRAGKHKTHAGILTNITQGKGKEGDIELLEEMAGVIKNAALCGLGQTAPNPVLSTIRYFRDEYEEHIRDHRCRAAVCSAMFKSPCQHTCPLKWIYLLILPLLEQKDLKTPIKYCCRAIPSPRFAEESVIINAKANAAAAIWTSPSPSNS